MEFNQNNIGYVTGGSLTEGFRIRLTVPAYKVQEGGFIVIESGDYKFYGIVTDLRLCAADPRFSENQIESRFPDEISSVLKDETLYTEMTVMPNLMLNAGPEPGTPGYTDFLKSLEKKIPDPMPVKTLPANHSYARLADAFDVCEIFGKPEDSDKFVIGTTREEGYSIRIDLEKFIQRSAGIFGATGTGKSYLTRLILAGLIHSKKASVLIFDMHNEYAYGDTSPDTKKSVPGLKDKLSGLVKVCSLGTGGQISKKMPDFDLVLEQSDIYPEDILMLSNELNLRDTTANTLAALEKCFGAQSWFHNFMCMTTGDAEGSVTEWAESNGVNAMAAEALHSKLNRVWNKTYIVEKAPMNPINQIIKVLENGQSVVLSFGKYESDLDYLLVSNILTRKIRDAWEKHTTDYNSGNGQRPKNLVIAVEEAHKLLNPEMASQTAFAVIAREMRKYFVTLLVIDQRPSKIYDEVMSQLGTRISGWLGDDADIAAVLSGLSGRDALRGMLAKLQPKEEVLLLGYGVPMPLPVRSQRYDDHFWKELLKNDPVLPFDPDSKKDWINND